MKVSLLATLLLVVAVACGGGATKATDSGIEGVTVSGPQCPVEVAGLPCPDKPFSAKLSISDQRSGKGVSAESDAQGRFRLVLEPGAYTIIPLSKNFPPTAPIDVIVRAHAFTHVTVRFDTGIR